jgi:hypothetical protein
MFVHQATSVRREDVSEFPACAQENTVKIGVPGTIAANGAAPFLADDTISCNGAMLAPLATMVPGALATVAPLTVMVPAAEPAKACLWHQRCTILCT